MPPNRGAALRPPRSRACPTPPRRPPQHLGVPRPGPASPRTPTPCSPQPPLPAPVAEAVKPAAAEPAPRAPASPLLPLCARERSWGGGRRGRSLCLSGSRRLCPGCSKCRWGGRSPGEGAGAGGAPPGRPGAVVPAARGGARTTAGARLEARLVRSRRPSAPLGSYLAPRHAEKSVQRRREGRKPQINSGGSSASSGGAGSAGRVRRLVLCCASPGLCHGLGAAKAASGRARAAAAASAPGLSQQRRAERAEMAASSNSSLSGSSVSSGEFQPVGRRLPRWLCRPPPSPGAPGWVEPTCGRPAPSLGVRAGARWDTGSVCQHPGRPQHLRA